MTGQNFLQISDLSWINVKHIVEIRIMENHYYTIYFIDGGRFDVMKGTKYYDNVTLFLSEQEIEFDA